MDESQEPGRPVVQTESGAEITVVLLDRHADYLDRLVNELGLQDRRPITRAQIIRGLIEASFQSNIDPAALKEFIAQFGD
jgi:hypothetical protein